ncbi:hypothetical protein EYF80_039940 [Liparis tanakae]|uniref:Uncharacterized protein n=1 Tax=Liparis tanakae TaxID=230148 RepID=A0A4Z2G8I6_9TELE|nr:hypothetical protein EYF80_039940 [Liparis tanakae]
MSGGTEKNMSSLQQPLATVEEEQAVTYADGPHGTQRKDEELAASYNSYLLYVHVSKQCLFVLLFPALQLPLHEGVEEAGPGLILTVVAQEVQPVLQDRRRVLGEHQAPQGDCDFALQRALALVSVQAKLESEAQRNSSSMRSIDSPSPSRRSSLRVSPITAAMTGISTVTSRAFVPFDSSPVALLHRPLGSSLWPPPPPFLWWDLESPLLLPSEDVGFLHLTVGIPGALVIGGDEGGIRPGLSSAAAGYLTNQMP